MVERKASLIENFQIVKETISFALKQEEERLYHNDMFMFPWEKVAFVISTLRPRELKKWISILSSFKYGKWVFDSVFPRYENPEDFHSTEYEICLTDRPVQVLGWKEQEELVQEGVKEGFRKDWIDVGFVLRSRERGIDLEWHFAKYPPQTRNENSALENGKTGMLPGK